MALFDEEERPKPARGFVLARLDGWSVEDLKTYIEALREEIVRAEAAIEARAAQVKAADSFFRKG